MDGISGGQVFCAVVMIALISLMLWLRGRGTSNPAKLEIGPASEEADEGGER